jgi:hypothetical protein
MIIGFHVPIAGRQKLTGKSNKMHVGLSLKTSPGCVPRSNSGEALYIFTNFLLFNNKVINNVKSFTISMILLKSGKL